MGEFSEGEEGRSGAWRVPAARRRDPPPHCRGSARCPATASQGAGSPNPSRFRVETLNPKPQGNCACEPQGRPLLPTLSAQGGICDDRVRVHQYTTSKQSGRAATRGVRPSLDGVVTPRRASLATECLATGAQTPRMLTAPPPPPPPPPHPRPPRWSGTPRSARRWLSAQCRNRRRSAGGG